MLINSPIEAIKIKSVRTVHRSCRGAFEIRAKEAPHSAFRGSVSQSAALPGDRAGVEISAAAPFMTTLV